MCFTFSVELEAEKAFLNPSVRLSPSNGPSSWLLTWHPQTGSGFKTSSTLDITSCFKAPKAPLLAYVFLQMTLKVHFNQFPNPEYLPVGACSVAQLCLPLCNPVHYSPPVHGIFLARILEWVAMSSSRGSFRPRDRACVLHLLHWQADSLPLSHWGSPNIFPMTH